jgi:hypothetical protein
METSQADVTSVKVRSFQSQIFLNGLRFHQLYAYVSLFSSTSNFLSNDVGCEHILIGRCEEKESWAKEAKQREKERKAASGAMIGIRHILVVMVQVSVEWRWWGWWWGFYLVEALTSTWINVCTSVVGCQSSVGCEALCTDMLLKAYW